MHAFAFYLMLISCKTNLYIYIYIYKCERKVGLFFKDMHYLYGYNNKKEMLYAIIIEDSMIRQAEKDRKSQTGRNIKEKVRELARC